jgi:Helix-turn-helix domain
MGQAPRDLTPDGSALHLFGAELRRRRSDAGLSQADLGRRTNYSGALVGKVEKAERVPSPAFAGACDRELATGGALSRLIRLVESERGDGRRADGAPRVPRTVPPMDVNHLRSVTVAFGRIDQQYGGGRLWQMVTSFLGREVLPSLTGCPSPALLLAASVLARKAGLVAMDGRRPAAARRYLDMALDWARASGDVAVVANILVTLAHHELDRGAPRAAARLAEAAANTDRDLPPPLLAKAHLMHARACARQGERRECERLVLRADRAFDRYRSGAARPGVDGISAVGGPYLAGQKAHCYTDLGMPGHAVLWAADAAGGYPDWQVRRRVMNAAVLASNLAAARRLDEAVAVGHGALTAAAGLHSSRGLDEIRRLEGAVALYRAEPQVREFLDRARELATI